MEEAPEPRIPIDDNGESIGYLRHNEGWPHVLTTVIAYSSSSAPSHDDLARRLSQMQIRFPDLRLKLVTRDPAAGQGIQYPLDFTQQKGPWPIDALLESHRLEDAHIDDAWNYALLALERRALVQAPLFLVLRMESADRTYIGLSVSHILLDGMGMVNLVRILNVPDLSSLPDESSAGFLVRNAGLAAKVVPEKAYEPWAPPAPKDPPELPIWPHGKDEYRELQTLDQPARFISFKLSEAAASRLKAACTVHQLPTFNPILLAAFVEAVVTTLSITDRKIQIIVPRSIRSATDPYVSGSHNTNYDISISTKDMQSTWETARVILDSMAAQQTEQSKPDAKEDGAPEPLYSPETIIRRQDEAGLQIPYRFSIIWSNLTKWSWLDEIDGVEDVLWGQSMTVTPSPLLVNLCGWKGGIRAVIGFREGCAVTSEEVREVVRRWREILEQGS